MGPFIVILFGVAFGAACADEGGLALTGAALGSLLALFEIWRTP